MNISNRRANLATLHHSKEPRDDSLSAPAMKKESCPVDSSPWLSTIVEQ